MNKLTLLSFLVQVFYNDLDRFNFSNTCHTIEYQHEGLLWVVVFEVARKNTENDIFCNMLTKQVLVQCHLQSCFVQSYPWFIAALGHLTVHPVGQRYHRSCQDSKKPHTLVICSRFDGFSVPIIRKINEAIVPQWIFAITTWIIQLSVDPGNYQTFEMLTVTGLREFPSVCKLKRQNVYSLSTSVSGGLVST